MSKLPEFDWQDAPSWTGYVEPQAEATVTLRDDELMLVEFYGTVEALETLRDLFYQRSLGVCVLVKPVKPNAAQSSDSQS